MHLIPKEAWISLAVVVVLGALCFLAELVFEDAQDYRANDRDAGYSLPEWTVGAALKRIFTGKK